MKTRYKIQRLFLLFAITIATTTAEDGDTGSPQFVYPVGDARRCLTSGNKGLLRLEVLPGWGWDNLQNKDAGMVMKLNYSKCLTTDDGRYLVPDSVYTIPRKSSQIDTYAELFTHWGNYSSTTSRSINDHAGLSFKGIGISGKHSKEYEKVKTRQFFDKAMTTRVQLRYVRYVAGSHPDFILDDAFKARLRKIAAHIELNRTDLATYESQLIVRDFGTHVTTSVDMGAALVQVDQVRESVFKSSEKEKNNALKAASASFTKVFSGGSNHGKSVTKEMLDNYQDNRTHSEIVTYGGPVFLPNNMSALEWSQSLENDMVALDRSGEPIYLLISSTTLPDLPDSTIYQLHSYIKAAVELYYEHNTYRGCTERDAPNFSFIANEDDGSCESPVAKYTFGGVYQTCSSSGDASLCDGLLQTNPLTGGFSCPDDYDAVLLQKDQKRVTVKHRKCHRCRMVHHCCHDKSHDEFAAYKAYWCSPRNHTTQNTGFLFGGLYTSTSFNPATQSMSCPSKFYPLHVVRDLSVCVTDDYELGLKDSLPFAGLFSCKAGNPLALQIFSFMESMSVPHSLLKYMEYDGKTSWPHECPQGFSQHIAVVDKGCQINYCIKTGALTAQSLPKVKRPPFMQLPRDITLEEETDFSFSDDGSDWNSMIEMTEATISQNVSQRAFPKIGDKREPVFLSAGSAAAIAVVGTLACVVVAYVALVVYRKRRQNRELFGTYRTLSYDGASVSEDTNLLRPVTEN